MLPAASCPSSDVQNCQLVASLCATGMYHTTGRRSSPPPPAVHCHDQALVTPGKAPTLHRHRGQAGGRLRCFAWPSCCCCCTPAPPLPLPLSPCGGISTLCPLSEALYRVASHLQLRQHLWTSYQVACCCTSALNQAGLPAAETQVYELVVQTTKHCIVAASASSNWACQITLLWHVMAMGCTDHHGIRCQGAAAGLIPDSTQQGTCTATSLTFDDASIWLAS
jgi:hypothetical protein